MARSDDEGENSPRSDGPSPAAVKIRHRPDPFLVVCGCFSFVTGIAAVLYIVVNVLSVVRSFSKGSDFRGMLSGLSMDVGLLMTVRVFNRPMTQV